MPQASNGGGVEGGVIAKGCHKLLMGWGVIAKGCHKLLMGWGGVVSYSKGMPQASNGVGWRGEL